MRTTAFTLVVVGVVATAALLSTERAGSALFSIEVTQDNVDFANYLAQHGKSYSSPDEF